MPAQNQKATALLAVALLAGSNAFVPNAALPTSRASSSTVMSAQKPMDRLQASAAAILAGVVTVGSLMNPVDAAMFTEGTETATVRSVGFGMPEPSSDPTNNNAASGKTNGPKYDIKQMGQFAKENSKGAVDYGSAKGTDFGPTGGNKEGIATNNKATEGDFLADAKRNTAEGVKIAKKNVKDAANVDVKDVSQQGRGSATIQDGINKVKDVLSSSSETTATAPTWGSQKSGSTLVSGVNLEVPNAVQDVGNAVKDKVQGAVDATSDLRDPNVDASIQTPKVGGFFGSKPRQQAQQTARKTADKVKSDVQTARNAAPNSVNDAGNAIRNKVSSDVQTAKNAAPNSLNDAGNAIKNKVSSDVQTAKNAAPNSANDAGNAIRNKVSSDVQTAKNAAPNSANDAGNAIRNKVSGDVQTAKNNLPNPDDANDIGSSIANKISAAKNAVSEAAVPGSTEARSVADGVQNKVDSDIRSAKRGAKNVLGDAVEAGSPASTLLSLDTPEVGGFFGTKPKQQADIVGAKTVQKVQDDIETARANPPFQNGDNGVTDISNFGGVSNSNNNGQAAKQAANAVKGQANVAKNNVKKQWQYVTKGNDAGRAVNNKVNSDINTAKSGFFDAKKTVAQNTPDLNDAGRAVNNKVNSDINTAKSGFFDAKKTVAQNTPDIKTPEVGGFFGTQPKAQADKVGAKTQAKVSQDINTVKKGILN